MKLTLPLPPNRANTSWGHWAKEKRARDNYWTLCQVDHPSRPPRPMTPVVLTVTFYMYNRMDEDNLVARLKWPIDWLVHREIIVDDNPANLTLGAVTQVIDRKNQRVEIEIVPHA